MQLLERIRVVNSLAPVADAFSGTVTKGIKCKGVGRILFIVYKGVGTTGTSTITVLAGDNATPSNSTAVTFSYRVIPADNVLPGAVTTATTSGFATTAGSGDTYLIEVDAKALAASGYAYCHVKAVELVDSPVLGGIIAIGSELRYADDLTNIVA